MAAIEIQNLVAGYDGRGVLKPLSLEMNGGIAVLVGANGGGKSTLLRTLAGTQAPVSGRVAVDGCDMHTTPVRKTARLVSLVYTDRTVAGDLTVEEAVALGRMPYSNMFGRLGSDDKRFVNDAMRSVGIDSMHKRKLATLSDGERQKTMIARALAQTTPLIIMDEPTSFLDAASRIEIMQLLARLRDEHGKTVILSTHDIAPAIAVADYLWVIDRTSKRIEHGRRDDIVRDGVLDHVFESAAVRFDSTAGDYRFSAT